MLILNRREGEEIVIGDDIRVIVQRIGGNVVRLSIEAPREVSIQRGELEPKKQGGTA